MSIPEHIAVPVMAVIDQLPINELQLSLSKATLALLAVRAAMTDDSALESVEGILQQARQHGDAAYVAIHACSDALHAYVQKDKPAGIGTVPSIEEAPLSDLPLINVEYIGEAVRLRSGGNEPKWIVKARMQGQTQSFINRWYDFDYIDNWLAFRRAGLPVPAAYRTAVFGGDLLIADVKEDGSEAYGKGLRCVLMDNEPRERPRPGIDPIFTNLMDTQYGAIEAAVTRYVEIANKKCIQLPEDDPFELVVHPDGSWELVILDLRYGREYTSPSGDFRAEIHKTNIQHAATFLKYLRETRTLLGPEGYKVRLQHVAQTLSESFRDT